MRSSYNTGDKVEEDEFLWRLVKPVEVVFDENLKLSRPSSMAFKDGNETLSVDIKGLTNIEKCRGKKLDHSIVEFTSKSCWDAGHPVIADPCPVENPENDAHAIVQGKFKKSFYRALARNQAKWIYQHNI